MAQTGWSFDRPRFYAIAISSLTNQVYELPGVSTWSWSKSDGGSAGTFAMRIPLQQDYDTVALTGSAGVIPYAAVANPMDIIALFCARTTVSINGSITPDPLELPFNISSLKYGDQNARSVKLLGASSNCIFIGMVDSVRESASPGEDTELAISGRDFTKIFEVNDVGVPDSGDQAKLGVGNLQGNPDSFFALQHVQLQQAKSGASLLVKLLDILCAKDLSTLAGGNEYIGGKSYADFIKSQSNRDAQAALQQFGFRYRDFVRLDAMDPDYNHIKDPLAFKPYDIQMGAVWSTLQELRNAPMTRLFVNEIGQLIFDDALTAWTGEDSDGLPATAFAKQYGRQNGVIGPEDIRSYDFGFDDSSLITFMSIMPAAATQGLGGIVYAKGSFLPGSGFVNGVAKAKNASEAHVQTYGYRYGQFESPYDLGFDDAKRRTKVVLTSVNSLYTASLTLRGNPGWRVGERYLVDIVTSRDQTTKKVWYVESIQSQGTWGEDWTTSVELKYPQDPESTGVARPQAR